jgi:DNA-binding response OmpR family regulator
MSIPYGAASIPSQLGRAVAASAAAASRGSVPMRVLFIEDSPPLQDAVARGLRQSGYAVDVCGDGPDGLLHARTTEYDVIVLDLMLPGRDGLSVLRSLRDSGCRTHVLILTAMDAVEDRVRGLRAGADDYLVKPFAFDELLARVAALARRCHGAKNPIIRVDDLVIDTGARRVERGGAAITLTPREYALLEYLGYRAGISVSRLELEEHLYDEDRPVMSNAVDSAVCALRAKLDVGSRRPVVHTRRGFGYMLGGEG